MDAKTAQDNEVIEAEVQAEIDLVLKGAPHITDKVDVENVTLLLGAFGKRCFDKGMRRGLKRALEIHGETE